MIYVDLKYITTVGIHLRNFKKKKDKLYNCSCPICGDSEKKKSKARGYFYQKGNSMFYKCHNCSAGMGVGNFLKFHFPTYHQQYILEKYRSGVETSTTKKVVLDVPKIALNSFVTKVSQKLSELDDAHYAKSYAIARKIPKEFFSSIFFTENFSELVNEQFPNEYENLPKNEPRLVIPFFDEQNKLIGFQGRSFSPEKSLRYITIRANNQVSLIYGLNRFNSKNLGYVVEGPIDSMFLPNCLAAANSDLSSVAERLNNANLVLIYDNEPRNKEIVRLMQLAIQNNKKICIWPKEIEQKDINEMILSGKTKEQILSIVNQRTFSGLSALLEFSQWKKI